MIFMRPFMDQPASALFEPYRNSFVIVQTRPDSPAEQSKEKGNNKRKHAEADRRNGMVTGDDASKGPTSKKRKTTKQVDPVVHLNKEDSQYVVEVEIPGARPDSVNVKVEDNVRLVVKAQRFHRDDNVIQFEKSLVFEERYFDLSKVRASLSDGVLSVCVPKRELPKPVDIQVSTSKPANHSVNSNEVEEWSIDLPGVKALDLKVKLDDDQVIIRAERHRKNNVFELSKTFTVDRKSVDLSKLEAFLVDGVLELLAPKRQMKPEKVAATKIISIDAGTVERTEKITGSNEDSVVASASAATSKEEALVAANRGSQSQKSSGKPTE